MQLWHAEGYQNSHNGRNARSIFLNFFFHVNKEAELCYLPFSLGNKRLNDILSLKQFQPGRRKQNDSTSSAVGTVILFRFGAN